MSKILNLSQMKWDIFLMNFIFMNFYVGLINFDDSLNHSTVDVK